MKIGIVGYQGSGKSTLFEWLTGEKADPSRSHLDQSAMAPVPDERIAQLCEIYQPKKVTQASLEIVDTPGLNRTHEGNPARLGLIREAGCMVIVVGAYDGADPVADLQRFEDDLLLADLDIVSGRVERLRESVKKPRPNRDEEIAELEALEPLVAILESGRQLSEEGLTREQQKATRSFRLLTEKPRLIVVNVADDETEGEKYVEAIKEKGPAVAIAVGLELELARMSEEDRNELIADMELQPADRDALLRQMLDVSNQMIYFTAGEKEVRTWMLHQGGTALEAADNIHSDLARGFIRAEVMKCSDLIRLGGERELKAQNLVSQEPKDYIVTSDDVINIKFSV
ncbi:MAG: DUF933 domain-containing protein [Planctomycetales bacterium]|nr:DUF933 domain-containing protein [Planctomycetales bacterium]